MLAVADGTWVVIGVVLVVVFGVSIGLFSRAGSEIGSHPRGPARGDTAGSEDDGRTADGGLPGTEGQRFPSSRGTR